jgi:hypothetical protein
MAGRTGSADRLNRQAAVGKGAYCSSMCSTASERLARIGMAIDELAADSLAPDRAGPDAGMQERLARIWAMIAELDPELARRVPAYDVRPADDE